MKRSIQVQIIIIIFLLLFVMPLSAFSADGQIKISTAPYVINKPGSYVLTSNLMVADPDVNAIRIDVNDVTLDLNGHTIQGPNAGGGNGVGIYANDRFNITIRNGRVWGFGGEGIALGFSAPLRGQAGHRIESIHSANNNYAGINSNGGGVILNCVANNNKGVGIYASNSTINNCTANNNEGHGFEVACGTTIGCTANWNHQHGFYVRRSLLSSCYADDNIQDGIHAKASVVSNCRANDNKGYGISMGLGVNGKNYVYRNAASDNTAGQINCLGNGTDNICVDNAGW
jgi:hypothetical protein